MTAGNAPWKTPHLVPRNGVKPRTSPPAQDSKRDMSYLSVIAYIHSQLIGTKADAYYISTVDSHQHAKSSSTCVDG